MAVRGGSGERALNVPVSMCCRVFSIEKYRHTHIQSLPILFITVSSFLNEQGGEKRGIVMEGEKDLLLGRQQRWDTAKREGGERKKRGQERKLMTGGAVNGPFCIG